MVLNLKETINYIQEHFSVLQLIKQKAEWKSGETFGSLHPTT
jgi:hypothetical protein